MRRILAAVILATATVSLLPPQSQAQIKIVSTTPDLGSIASAIGGNLVEVSSIATGRSDPHFIQARPIFMARARDAHLWIRNGLELEVGWEPLLLDGARNPAIRPGQLGHFDASEAIERRLEVSSEKLSRAKGDVHPSGNPHYMLDPYNARMVAYGIAKRLGEIDKSNQAIYQDNLKSWVKKLDSKMFGRESVEACGGNDLWSAMAQNRLEALLESRRAELGGWARIMKPWKGKSIVTFHKSFLYFIDRFSLSEALEIEPLPGIPPSPAHLAQLTKDVGARGARLIVMEPFYPVKPAEFVKEKTGIDINVVSTYASSTDDNAYFNMMDSIVDIFNRH